MTTNMSILVFEQHQNFFESQIFHFELWLCLKMEFQRGDLSKTVKIYPGIMVSNKAHPMASDFIRYIEIHAIKI